MKFLSAFVVLVLSFSNVLAMSEEMLELVNMLHKTCQEETGVAEDAILNARKGQFADDNNLKCYMKCLLTQMAVMEDDGSIDIEGMLAVVPDDENKPTVVKVISGCGTKVGADHCDNAFLTNKCWQEGSPALYFLP